MQLARLSILDLTAVPRPGSCAPAACWYFDGSRIYDEIIAAAERRLYLNKQSNIYVIAFPQASINNQAEDRHSIRLSMVTYKIIRLVTFSEAPSESAALASTQERLTTCMKMKLHILTYKGRRARLLHCRTGLKYQQTRFSNLLLSKRHQRNL